MAAAKWTAWCLCGVTRFCPCHPIAAFLRQVGVGLSGRCFVCAAGVKVKQLHCLKQLPVGEAAEFAVGRKVLRCSVALSQLPYAGGSLKLGEGAAFEYVGPHFNSHLRQTQSLISTLDSVQLRNDPVASLTACLTLCLFNKVGPIPATVMSLLLKVETWQPLSV